MHILFTRPFDDCSELMLRFKSLGHLVSHIPVIRIEKINYEDLDFNKLTCSYWLNIMKNKLEEDDSIENIIKVNNLSDSWFVFKFKIIGRYKSKLKVFKYYLKKVGRLINIKNEN